MKISKVNHMKTGVAAQPIENGGMLYSHPSNSQDSLELDKHIRYLSNRAQKLYKVMITPLPTRIRQNNETVMIYTKKAAVGELVNGLFDDCILNSVKDRNINKKVFFENLLNKKFEGKEYKRKKDILVLDEGKIVNVIDECLRESLRVYKKVGEKKFYIPDVIKKLAKCAAAIPGSGEIKDIPKEEVMACIDAMVEDCTNRKRTTGIAESIELQNVPVQVAKDNNLIILSSAYKEKKKFVFEFLKEYASKDTIKQNDVLNHMRYLILLYIYGEDTAYGASQEIDGVRCVINKEFHLVLETQDGSFSELLVDLRSDIDNIPDSQKAAKRRGEDRFKNEVSKCILNYYQKAINKVEGNDNDIAWIRFISDRVAKILSGKKCDMLKLQKAYLYKTVWAEWISYIAQKYIEMGKGVYHFALTNLDEVGKGQPVKIGMLDPKFRKGISSFDYEYLTAEDNLSRSLSQYVTFAINNFDSSVRNENDRKDKNKEDILSVKNISISADAKWKLLRYFGGNSSFAGTEIENCDTEELVNEFKKYFIQVRNTNFHFVGGKESVIKGKYADIVLEKEIQDAGKLFSKKFYSNNLPKFYSEEKLRKIMDILYKEQRNDPAQIPSFNKVLSKNKATDFIGSLIPSKNRSAIHDVEKAELFKNAFYFLLKEIYYNDFLQDKKIKEKFMDAIRQLEPKHDSQKRGLSKEERAYKDFADRLKIINTPQSSFGEICQEIMTEYNQQNNQKSKKPSAISIADQKGNPTELVIDDGEKYKHFREFLYQGIREAFKRYLKNKSEYVFLFQPGYFDNVVAENEFMRDWNTPMYETMREKVFSSVVASSWYVTAHFLNQKQLNHLIGQVKTYIQYIESIQSRAKQTGNWKENAFENNKEIYVELLAVLEFVKLYCGSISNVLEDYFLNADDYAQYVAKFIDFDVSNGVRIGLESFCNEKLITDGDGKKKVIGRYYDGENPILDRNIVIASIYGNSSILSKVVKHVTREEILYYDKKKNEVVKILAAGAKDKSELATIREYQNLKNRIELVDVLQLSELTNDILSQFIGLVYLRERDLMYMQLGYHYIKLFYTDVVKKDSYLRKLQGDCQIEDGAVLYQIAAMYSYSLPVYHRKDENIAVCNKNESQIGEGVKVFAEEYCQDGYKIYSEGLYFFEDVDKRHKEYINTRKYIEHFKYYAKTDKSLLDIYGELYNGFFSYNTKLRKSISYILPNLLLSYFVNVKLGYDKEKGIAKWKENGVIREKEINKTKIVIKEIKTDYFTYKDIQSLATTKNEEQNYRGNAMKNGKSDNGVKVFARSEIFLEEVSRLLSFKIVN